MKEEDGERARDGFRASEPSTVSKYPFESVLIQLSEKLHADP